MTTPHRRQKALAYITHGNRLLVYREIDTLEKGLQLPGGGIDPGETPEQAVLREAYEETGLENLRIVRFLGTFEADLMERKGRMEDVHAFHLVVEGEVRETWRHVELYDSDQQGPVELDFFWWDLSRGLPEVVPHHSGLLHELDVEKRFSPKKSS